MVFDADVHLSVTEKNGLTAEEALRAMDRAGIDPGQTSGFNRPICGRLRKPTDTFMKHGATTLTDFPPQAGLILISGLAAQRKCSAVAWKITACMP